MKLDKQSLKEILELFIEYEEDCEFMHRLLKDKDYSWNELCEALDMDPHYLIDEERAEADV